MALYLPSDSVTGRLIDVDLLADYLELSAFFAADATARGSDLANAASLAAEDRDGMDGELRHGPQTLIDQGADRIRQRQSALGSAYPFELGQRGEIVTCRMDNVALGQAAYLLSLVLSHLRSVSPVLDGSDLHPCDEEVRRLRQYFQGCATAALAAEVQGAAWSFGFPRPDGSGFLEKLEQIWKKLRDGTVARQAGAPDRPKDDHIDVFAARTHPDGLPGFLLAAAQVATGANWRQKSLLGRRTGLKRSWFSTPPVTDFIPYMVVPFATDDKRFVDDVGRMGNVLHRLRVPRRVGGRLPQSGEGGGMRHRFHSICPYFAMFPETFVEKHLAASPHAGVVFDPYCGRGTTVFQALLQGRAAAGSDVHPVAVCVAGAKGDPPSLPEARARLDELRRGCREPEDAGWQGDLGHFFDLCFHRDTLPLVRYLRSALDWRDRRDDRFIAALCLGALHGESHKSPNCFSNRMPRTISTKPDYSVRWWTRRGYEPPWRDVFEILERMLEYRFRSTPPDGRAAVVQMDARRVAEAFPALAGRVTDVITSPPYLDTTNYREDQWLRLWFLGGAARIPRGRGDDRHYGKGNYWTFIEESMRGLAPLLAERARLVLRIGGRRLRKAELRAGLVRSLRRGLERDVSLIDDGVTTEVARTQANVFRGARVSRFEEHDFCFAV